MNANLRKCTTALLSIALISALALSVFATGLAPAENAAPSAALPIMYDDDFIMWDDNSESFKQICAWWRGFHETVIEDEEVPLSAAPTSVLPIMYGNDVLMLDFMEKIFVWFHFLRAF